MIPFSFIPLIFMMFISIGLFSDELLSEERATFAGGCFWCVEEAFEHVEGVLQVTSGYTGGQVPNPSYEDVSAGNTGHAEAVEVLYNPQKISYSELLTIFWKNIDPTVQNRQFCDVGSQYRSAIFVHSEEQRREAEESLHQLRSRFPVIHTVIEDAGPFYPAEDYHQNYAEKNPYRYRFYRYSCGRDARLEDLWGEME